MVAVNTEFSYYTNGQLESRVFGNEKESFLWDGLALIKKNDVDYTNEPYVTGGNPILANDKVMFNDMLGNTLGKMDNGKFSGIQRTAFGETIGKVDHSLNFFTGKPKVEGLGYNFLSRNYKPDLIVIDGNNSNSAVTPADALTVGTCSSGGAFNVDTLTISKDSNGGLVIIISISLNIANI